MLIDLEYLAAQTIRARALVNVDSIRMVMVHPDGQCSLRLPDLTLRLVPEWPVERLLAVLPMAVETRPGAASGGAEAQGQEGGPRQGGAASPRRSTKRS